MFRFLEDFQIFGRFSDFWKIFSFLKDFQILGKFSDFWKVFRFLEYIGIIFLPVVTNKMPQFMKGSSSFGDFCGNKEFSDVTLACEDGQLVEAHEVILAGPSPKTTIHTPWFQLGDILSSKLQKEREGF